MKRIIFALFCFSVLLFIPLPAFASSETSYQDYLFQFDQYRQKYNDFQIARNEYLKFKSLASETAAIEKTREMMASRAQLLRAYLLLLNEKMNEATTLTESERDFYFDSIQTENSFLENHIVFVGSIDTIEDLIKASKQLEDRYKVLQSTMRQTVLILNLARLRILSNEYVSRLQDAKNLVDEAKKELNSDQTATLDRWLLQIGNKRTLYLQKQDQIVQDITGLKGSNIQELDKKYQETTKKITEAHQELKAGTAFMAELANAMKYKN